MAAKNTILVVGATGAQGGSVARHLLKSGKFHVRALTRDPDSPKAAALHQAGAQPVKGDLEDVPALRAALDGCWGAFGVTSFWEHFGKELQHGINLVDAVKAAGVPHFIFSGLPHVKKATGGALEAPHFDMKAEIEDYARRTLSEPTFVHVAFYFDNFLGFFPPRAQGDGSFTFGFPQGDTPLAGVAVEDVGGVVTAIFRRAEEFRGRTVGIVGDDLPGKEYAAIMSRVLGRKIVYHHIPKDEYAALGFPGADDLANMFEFNRLHIPDRRADVAESRALYPDMQSFETWMKRNRGKFRLDTRAVPAA